MRWLFFGLGCVCVVVGAVGLYVPGLPGTVFFLVAAACFARSSKRAEAWLLSRPKLGPAILAWREKGAIARPGKIAALSGMTIGFIASAFLLGWDDWLFWLIAIMIALSAWFVITRPDA